MRDLFSPIQHEPRSRGPIVVSVIIHLSVIPLAILIGRVVLSTSEVPIRPPIWQPVPVFVPATFTRSHPTPRNAPVSKRRGNTTTATTPVPPSSVPNVGVGSFDIPTSVTRSRQSDTTIVTGAFDMSAGRDDHRAAGGGTLGPVNTFDAGSGPASGGAAPEASAQDEPAELLSIPIPAYTEDARRRRITGKVVLKVKLCVNGSVEVLDVIAKLDDGLDQAAIDAVKKLRVKPARLKGVPSDVIGRITVVFALT